MLRVITGMRTTKVVAAETAEASALLAEIYGAMTVGGVFVARDIRSPV